MEGQCPLATTGTVTEITDLHREIGRPKEIGHPKQNGLPKEIGHPGGILNQETEVVHGRPNMRTMHQICLLGKF